MSLGVTHGATYLLVRWSGTDALLFSKELTSNWLLLFIDCGSDSVTHNHISLICRPCLGYLLIYLFISLCMWMTDVWDHSPYAACMCVIRFLFSLCGFIKILWRHRNDIITLTKKKLPALIGALCYYNHNTPMSQSSEHNQCNRVLLCTSCFFF